MKNSFRLLGLLACTAVPFVAGPVAYAQSSSTQKEAERRPLLHPLFTDNAVLQRDRPIPIWGWATPGANLSVGIDGKKFWKTRAGADGKWMVRIGPYKAGGPHTLTVDGSVPGEMATRSNILFGDVWLCSGQSNMEWGIDQANNGQQEIAAANYPDIRLFTVPQTVSGTPRQLVNSQWLVCNPTNIAAGKSRGFSAVAYFFGRKLHQELKVPIGLIHSSWGGTVAEAWVHESALGNIKDFDGQVAAVKKSATSELSYEEQNMVWLREVDKGEREGWAGENADVSGWSSINAPGNWEAVPELGLQNFDGLAWYRREVDVPAEWAGKDLSLQLGSVDDHDTTFWNGKPVGANFAVSVARNYKIPGAEVKAGRNVIAIRVYDTGGLGGLTGRPEQMKLELAGQPPLSLVGSWKLKTSVPSKELTSGPIRIDNPNVVTVLNNGMIAPLAPYGLKGAIWYQGESNASRAEQYGRLLPVLINGWRRQFDTPLSFYIVQLAGYMNPDDAPRDDEWPRLREAQMNTAQTVERTGIATAIDVGEAGDIHPKNKQDVGLRLALAALAQDYGKKIPFDGPTLKSARRNGNKMVLRFDNAAGGLTLRGDANRVFAVAGADKKWVWADAVVENGTVVLTSAEVKEPVYVRYAWSNFPRAHLYNGAELPAMPFRTDK